MEKIQNFANAIKQLRKSKSISLDQISESCNIKKNYLEKLESENFTFKSEVYIKLFLKEYLKYINLDKSESIIQEYDNISSPNNIDSELTFMPASDDKIIDQIEPNFEYKDYNPKQIASVIFIIIIIVSIYQIITTLLV